LGNATGIFDELDREFHFTLDPCCTSETAKCSKYYTPKENGLLQDWSGETVFCNPPYGKDLPKWIEKCASESKHAKVVMLIPARTDTIAFHKYIYNKSEIRFIKGRLKFRVDGKEGDPAPFPSMVVIFP
jgi:site-specific DNA-methyltransferase (adenine-specific)